MNIKKMNKFISVVILFILFMQIIFPTLSSYAMQEQLENDIIQENEVSEKQIEEIESKNSTDIISNKIDKDSSLENSIIDEESEIIFNNENVLEENQPQNIDEIDEITSTEDDTIIDKNKWDLLDISTDEIIDKNGEDIIEVEKFEEINTSKLMMNSLISSSSIMVANETEFRNAINNGYSTLITKNGITFSNPITIDRSITIKPTSSENSINYSGYGSFITVVSGGRLDLSSIVVYTNGIGANHNLIGINIESGGTVIFNENSIVDGGSGNTGILVNSGGTLYFNSCHIANSTKGVVAKENSTIMFGNLNNGRCSEFWSNTTAISFEDYTGTSNFNQSNIKIRNNTNGIVCTSGNINISGGTIYSNGNGVLQRNSILNINGGNFYNNNYGINLESGYSGKMTINNINMYSNYQNAITHNQTNDKNCTILGGSISGKIYLGKENNYINTNENFPTLEIIPSSYYFKRRLVKTNSNEIAKTEIQNVSVTPKDSWYKYVDQEYIVLWKNSNLLITCYDADIANHKLVKNGISYNDMKYIEGAIFNILDSDGNVLEEITTDENGKALSKEYPLEMQLIVIQVSSINNYILNNTEKTINLSDSENKIDMPNEHEKGKISITKMDKDDKDKLLEGIKFELYADEIDFPFEANDKIGTYQTDENGKINIDNIWTGSYKLVEVETKNSYLLNEDVNNVTIANNEIKNIEVLNEAKKDKISITVKDFDTENPLKDIEFVIQDKNGNEVGRIITDEKGYAISDSLRIDEEYVIYQENTLDNYKENDEEIEVNFIEEFGYETNKVFEINVKNKHEKGNIEISKVDYDNSDVILPGFTFELYVDDVDLPYKKDDYIGTYTTDENGKIMIEDLWTGKYYFKEIESEASKFYQLIENNIELNVINDSTNYFSVKNEKQKGQIEINKKVSLSDSSITGLKKGSVLKGATFEIINELGEVVDKIVTDENGYAISNRLPIDEIYIIRESLAPKYYLKDESSKSIRFSSNNEIVSLNFENEAVKTNLSIEKKGIIQAQPNDEIRYNFKNLKNLSNVELNNFTFIDSLPVQQVTITKLFTGVYSHELKYDVYYKTNQSNWNIIAKDLNSTVNHYINLPLNDNEVVTDVKIEFGTVPVGFEATSTPFIFTKVNNDIVSTDKWVNKCILLGEYEDIKLMSTAEWKTITYVANLKNSLYNNSLFNKFSMKVLPKTGR